jgi:hypothetical protein
MTDLGWGGDFLVNYRGTRNTTPFSDITDNIVANIGAKGLAVWDVNRPSVTLRTWKVIAGAQSLQSVRVDDEGFVFIGDLFTRSVIVTDLDGNIVTVITLPVGPQIANQNMGVRTFSGTTYIFLWRQTKLNLISGSGGSYQYIGRIDTFPVQAVATFGTPNSFGFSISPSRFYVVIGNLSRKDIRVVNWSPTGFTTIDTIDLSGFISSNVWAIYYEPDSDEVVVLPSEGGVYVFTPDMSTLKRSVSEPWSGASNRTYLEGAHLKSGPDRISFRVTRAAESYILEYRLSDLTKILDERVRDHPELPRNTLSGFTTAGVDPTNKGMLTYGESPALPPTYWFLGLEHVVPEGLWHNVMIM